MSDPYIYSLMAASQAVVVKAIRAHAEQLLNCSPRFKLFTLHGTPHIKNLFAISDLMIRGGVKISADEAYLLSLAICVHDLGMVVGLKDHEISDLLRGKPEASEPATVENQIRDIHHILVDKYIENNFNFMVGLGLSATDLTHVAAIAKCHRKVVLLKQYGFIKYLGALLRVIDELDISSERAPLAVLQNQYVEMDATSLWHWVKHSIVESWKLGHNVTYKTTNGRQAIDFVIIAHPSSASSAQFWLIQTRRPIVKALLDDGCAAIIQEHSGVLIEAHTSLERSTPAALGEGWKAIEEKALTGGRKVILLVDDEVRKMEDLMLPITYFAHVLYGYSALDAFTKLAAGRVDLVIVDIQIPGVGVWSAEETGDYKTTGINIIKKIKAEYPNVKIGVLTGTRHETTELDSLGLKFLLRKPCDPEMFEEEIKNALN